MVSQYRKLESKVGFLPAFVKSLFFSEVVDHFLRSGMVCRGLSGSNRGGRLRNRDQLLEMRRRRNHLTTPKYVLHEEEVSESPSERFVWIKTR